MPHRNRFLRRCRIYFRHVRIATWLVLLAVVGALIYLNQVGLPEFVKRPVLEKLRARGLDIEFSRLRLSWYGGVIAENIRFLSSSGSEAGPQLTLAEAQVQFNHKALMRLQFQVDALTLRRGRLALPLAQSNQPTRYLAVEDIQTDLRFLPNDEWALDNFRAVFSGANIQLSGTISHASAVRDWPLFQPAKRAPAAAGQWPSRLRQLADALERIRFSAPPDLRLDVRGDARDPRSFAVRLWVTAPGARTPWGNVRGGRFTARLLPTTNEWSHADLSLAASEAQTQWANITNLNVSLHVISAEGLTNSAPSAAAGPQSGLPALGKAQPGLVAADLSLQAGSAETKLGCARQIGFTIQWVHALTNPIPLLGEGRLKCGQAQTRWGSARNLDLSGHFARPSTNAPLQADASWAQWAKLEPYAFDWECRLGDFHNDQAAIKDITCGGSWQTPTLTLTNLHVRLQSGHIEAHAGLNVASRRLEAGLLSDLDPHVIAPLLPEGAQRWLAQLTWNKPPVAQARATLVLPPWTNFDHAIDCRAQVLPSLQLQGELNLAHGGSFRAVPVSAVHSHFAYSNMCLELPDLVVERPEGRLRAAHHADQRTRDFYWRIDSTLDVGILGPLLDPGTRRAFDLFSFTQPPVISAEIWGCGLDPARTGVKGRVAMTNFTFRGESVGGFATELQYTNQLLRAFSPRLQRGREGREQMSADGLTADLRADKLYLTNGFSTAEPMVVARAIGPNIVRAVRPYHFSQPPTVHAHGTIPLHGLDADLFFQVEGGPFDWMKFHLPQISGNLHWTGLRLALSDVNAAFYGGQAKGSASFYFSTNRPGTDFEFNLATTNTLIQALMADWSSGTNHLEGHVNAVLTVAHANTEDWRSVDGRGSLDLRDGLIWDIPLFGILSPALDTIMPGMGSSRATAGACSFVITNGVIRTDNLEIRSPAMRLLYHGTTDLQGQVHARVEAELLRDVFLIGPLVSTALRPVTKLFEFKVTGSLADPKIEPLYLLPKLILMPLHPWSTLKGLFPKESSSSSINGPGK